MDPNQILKEIRDLANKILETDNDELLQIELAEAVLNLDQWLSKGGFLPDSWKRP